MIVDSIALRLVVNAATSRRADDDDDDDDNGGDGAAEWTFLLSLSQRYQISNHLLMDGCQHTNENT